MVHTMTGKLCAPTLAMVPRFKENPKMMTAHCKIFLDVNLIPSFILSSDASLGRQSVINIPNKIAKTGAPMTSIEKLPMDNLASTVAMAAMTVQITMPSPFFFKKIIVFSPCNKTRKVSNSIILHLRMPGQL